MSEIAMELNSHQRGEYGKPCAAKVARTVWSRGKAQALPIATREGNYVIYIQSDFAPFTSSCGTTDTSIIISLKNSPTPLGIFN